jgi:hypothetical protein
MLDLNAIAWLEDYLQSWPGTILVVYVAHFSSQLLTDDQIARQSFPRRRGYRYHPPALAATRLLERQFLQLLPDQAGEEQAAKEGIRGAVGIQTALAGLHRPMEVQCQSR